MEIIYLVAVGEGDGSRRALAHAIERAKIIGARIVLGHIIEWSPYTLLTPDELSERPQKREDEISHAEASIIEPLISMVAAAELSYATIVRHGKITEALNSIAKELGAFQIVIGRSSAKDIKTRIFDTISSKLVQVSDVPVLVVP